MVCLEASMLCFESSMLCFGSIERWNWKHHYWRATRLERGAYAPSLRALDAMKLFDAGFHVGHDFVGRELGGLGVVDFAEGLFDSGG